MSQPAPQAGTLLTGQEIAAALEQDLVFQSDTWTPDNLRGAGYDLRLSDDLLVVPDHRGGVTIYESGDKCSGYVDLEPGDTAVVSTQERMQLSWSLAGNIGPKFNLAAQGLLIMSGLCVDPGYGLRKDENGSWIAAGDERLIFSIANVGSQRVTLKPGSEPIAVLQLFSVNASDPDLRVPISSPGRRSFASSEIPLGLFGLEKKLTESLGQLDERLTARCSDVETRVREVETRVAGVVEGSHQVVLFGVYLLAVTFLGLTTTLLLNLLEDLPKDPTLVVQIAVIVGAFAFLVMSGLGIVLAFPKLWALSGLKSKPKQ